ncbi:general secretion pathway protein GspD [Aliarcobacter trophiarum LMG 25534]|uniref:General secretion pathway protein GspD n=1 Tax=Aliarcobacter trophiarum LMG 25534 TaxID=1032241 RepID=A0AAD0VLP2_9BACT|nr:secretin N-terminal domain-containing protein [Aliarcobacter trophiarum]AXK48379.1 type II secretion/transformation system, D protein [Aliarcobacter trophiarum LMG 25534]RXJ92951.1 general secretion pathway protein GspD [Aliarcobacter trophiarum LMG 25534]
MKWFLNIFFLFILTIQGFSNDYIDVNFTNLKLDEFVNIVSKVSNKNILVSEPLDINLNFVSNKKVKKDELLTILKTILEEHNYILEQKGDFLKIGKKLPPKKENSISKVYELKNIEVENIVKILESIIERNSYEEGLKPNISFIQETNSIVLTGQKDILEPFFELLKEIDKQKEQVYIQAKIIEVKNELVNKIGLSYGILKADSSSDGIMAISTSLNGGSKSLEDAATLLGIDVKKLNLKSGLALGASLNLLKQQGALDIVSEPSILAINNKESFIYVGEKISMQTSSSVTDGGTQRTNYEREDIGLTLKVKPRVSSNTKLTLEINTLLENLKVRSVGVSNPDTLKKEINTTAILSNGESVIIGGLIENKNEIVEEKVPVLGDVPIFGRLFRNESNLNKKNNLVIIVTPYIIQKNQDITYIRDKLTKLKELEERYLEESLSDLNVELKTKDKKELEDAQTLQEKRFKEFFQQQ